MEVGRGVVGLEPDRLSELFFGLLRPAQASQGLAQVVTGQGVVGLVAEGLPVVGRRLVGLAQLGEARTGLIICEVRKA